MYYAKTDEYFRKYRCSIGKYKITFRLIEAQIEQNNLKGDRKFFKLFEKNPIHFSDSSDELEIRFLYGTLTEDEKENYGRRQSQKIQEDLMEKALVQIKEYLEINSISGIMRSVSGDAKPLLQKHLEAYIKRNTKDFFIHKNLKKFLSNELDFYLKNEVWQLDVLENEQENQINLMKTKSKTIRNISTKIIEFLSQIEEFQKKLFEKKKMILKTDYCITLDLIPESLYEEIGLNEKQVAKWKELYQLDIITNSTFYNTNNKNTFNPELLKKYKYMMLDTCYYNEEIKYKILENIINIDDNLNGILIQGENYQVINLLKNTYNQKIKCVYIDPPYNTGNDEFIYKDKYKHSSWMTMINDRVIQIYDLLNEDGVIFVSIDDNEMIRLNMILQNIFGEENWVALFITRTNPRGRTLDRYVAKTNDYITSYVKNVNNNSIIGLPKSGDKIKEYNKEDSKGKYRELGLRNRNPVFTRENRPNLYYPIYVNPENGLVSLTKSQEYNIEVYPKNSKDEDDCWTWGKEKVNNNLSFLGAKYTSTGRWSIYRKDYLIDESGNLSTTLPKSIWLEKEINNERGKEALTDIMGYSAFDFPKSVGMIKKCVKIGSNKNSYIADFFSGSGVTAQAVIELNREDDGNRKYIAVDMVKSNILLIKDRILKIVFASEWKNGLPNGQNGVSQIIKYSTIEQYEDTLNNIEFIKSDKSIQSKLDRLPDYFLYYMLDYETKDSPTRISVNQFKTPFSYLIKTISGGEERQDSVDLVETFNYLLGLKVNGLKAINNGDRLYKIVFGNRENEKIVIIWRDISNLDLKIDKEFIDETILSHNNPDVIYINGDSYVENAFPIEPEFRRLMGA